MSAVRDRLAALRRNLIAVRGRIMHARERVSLAEQRHAHAISYAGQSALTQADPRRATPRPGSTSWSRPLPPPLRWIRPVTISGRCGDCSITRWRHWRPSGTRARPSGPSPRGVGGRRPIARTRSTMSNLCGFAFSGDYTPSRNVRHVSPSLAWRMRPGGAAPFLPPVDGGDG